MSLEKYATEYVPHQGIDNLMVKMMVGLSSLGARNSRPLYKPDIAKYILGHPPLMLAMAKRNLLHFSYFGVMVSLCSSPPPSPTKSLAIP